MLCSQRLRISLSTCIFLIFFTTSVSGYFLIDEPHRDTKWINNQPNLVKWQKGLLDGIHEFDVEMARLSTDGLTLVARNVPAQQETLNIYIQDIQPADDYFLVFMNSTHGVMHATSPRFTILDSGSNPASNNGMVPDSAVPTVTVSGKPDPTKAFATTFPAVANSGAGAGRRDVVPGRAELMIIALVTAVSMAVGGTWTMS